MQKLDSQADGEQAAEGPGPAVGLKGETGSPPFYQLTIAGRLELANDRLHELRLFLSSRFGIVVENPLNAPQAAMDKLEEMQRQLVRGNGK